MTELPRPVIQQLAEVVRQMPDGPVEIRLDPEELGRLRMTLSPTEAGLSVNLMIERDETAQLIRRHLDQLASEFRALGYAELEFSFSGNGSDDPGSGQDNADPRAIAPETGALTADLPGSHPSLQAARSSAGRVDLRL